MSSEKDIRDRFLAEFDVEERAAIYATYYTIALGVDEQGESNYAKYDWMKQMSPLLRYGIRSDDEAQRYVRDHPERYGGFRLNAEWMVDQAVKYNYAVVSGESGKAVEDLSLDEKLATGDDITDDFGQLTGSMLLGTGEMRRDPIPETMVIPINEMMRDWRPYQPLEETLGMNIWPMVGAIALLPVAAVAGGVTMGSLVAASLVAPKAVFGGLAAFTSAHPIIHNLGRTGSLIAGGTLLASMGMATADPFYDMTPEQREAAEAQMAAHNVDKFADRVNIVVSGEPAPEGVSPVEQSQAYANESQSVISQSSQFPSEPVAESEPPAPAPMSLSGSILAPPLSTPTGTPNSLQQSQDDYTAMGQQFGDEAVAAYSGDPQYEAIRASLGQEQARIWAIQEYSKEPEPPEPDPRPSPYIGEGIAGSPIQGPTLDPTTGHWSRGPYQTQRNTFAQGIENATIGSAAVSAPMYPTYDENDFTRIIGGMTPGQTEEFIEQAVLAGVISEDYVYRGVLDMEITAAMQSIMYQANLSGRDWQGALDTMINVYQAHLEEQKEQNLQEWYNNFVPDAPYFELDPATIEQTMKASIRQQLGRNPNQWEIDMAAGWMTADHEAAYAADVAGQREVWNAMGRAKEYDEPQDQTLGTVEAVDEEARFAERFEERYDVEMGEMDRRARIEEDTTNMFSGLSQLSRMGGGV